MLCIRRACGREMPDDAIYCPYCGKKQITTEGGTKYHSRSDCSGMEDPEYVTKDTAIKRGFGPCGRCY